MAGTKRNKITERDITGLKYFDKLGPLLERLHEDGCGTRTLESIVPCRHGLTSRPTAGDEHDDRSVLDRTLESDRDEATQKIGIDTLGPAIAGVAGPLTLRA